MVDIDCSACFLNLLVMVHSNLVFKIHSKSISFGLHFMSRWCPEHLQQYLKQYSQKQVFQPLQNILGDIKKLQLQWFLKSRA
jgi:predicted solute-binding protein